jgi:hypothetical protein
VRRSVGEVQSIVLPVTGDNAVRVFRAGRNIRLTFRCGLVLAKVMNAWPRHAIGTASLPARGQFPGPRPTDHWGVPAPGRSRGRRAAGDHQPHC